MNAGCIPANCSSTWAHAARSWRFGPANNVAAALIRERQAGIVSSDPAEIADHLACWLDMKERGADIPDLPESVAAGLSRQEQTRRLERFLLQIAGNPSVNRHNERIL